MRVKRTQRSAEPTYIISGPHCCNGYGYLFVVDEENQPYDRVACWCPAGKRWSGKAA
ncbi:hypothetical protein [Microbispora sp. NBC_01389]|uniref:hypothetical protein n=1 Tax=Microbispora sp. NBC_01389 TaxID=2903584 RepID=UPI003253EC45